MRRREFIKGAVGSAVAAWPLAARAQQAAMPVVGFVSSRSPDDSADLVAAFRAGLSETGFVENRNVVIEFHWAEDQYDRLPMVAADLVAHQVAAIVAANTPRGWRPRRQLRKFRSSFSPVPTQLKSGWSKASTDQMAISPAWLCLTTRWPRSSSSC
jgi:hypothetical protein